MINKFSLTDPQAIESRLAARLVGALATHSAQLAPDVNERLRFAREQALTRARLARRAAPVAAAGAMVMGAGSAVLAGFVPWWQRAMSVLPVIALVLGLVGIDRWAMREQVLAAADIDARLLADTLPPAAYSDPGFAEFLRSAPSP